MIHAFISYKMCDVFAVIRKHFNGKRIVGVNNVRSQMRKGMLEYYVILLLHKEPAYASDIIQKLKKARLIVVEGTLYPLLARLRSDDLLSYEWIESTQGPPRKCYKLTKRGEAFLSELETSWQELNNTVDHIANS